MHQEPPELEKVADQGKPGAGLSDGTALKKMPGLAGWECRSSKGSSTTRLESCSCIPTYTHTQLQACKLELTSAHSAGV